MDRIDGFVGVGAYVLLDDQKSPLYNEKTEVNRDRDEDKVWKLLFFLLIRLPPPPPPLPRPLIFIPLLLSQQRSLDRIDGFVGVGAYVLMDYQKSSLYNEKREANKDSGGHGGQVEWKR